MIILIILLIVAWLGYKHYVKTMFYWRSINVQQGTPVPVLGDSFNVFFKRISETEFVKQCYNKFKNERYSGIYQGNMRTLVLHDPELIKQVTVKDFDHFVDHTNFAGDLEPLWSKNLFALKGEKWREMRATLSPSFTSIKMRSMFELMEKSAQQYVEFYLQQNEDVIELELKDSFTRFSSDVIANCAFGITVDSLKDPSNEFYKHGKEITNLSSFSKLMTFLVSMFMPSVAKLLGLRFFAKETTDFFKAIIRDTLKFREEKNIYRPDMINQLIEARKGQLKYDEVHDKDVTGFATVEESDIGKASHGRETEMSEEDMAAQVLVFFFAGFDTISTLMSFVCYELAVHPDVQDKLRKEVDATLKTNDGKLGYEKLNQMKYLDMVVTETLRKTPPFSAVDRLCTKAYTIKPERPNETPVHLQPGDVLWLPIVGIQSDEQYYPSPDKFDPERFSDENKANIQPYTFLPFGAGPRNCIGSRFALMEAKTIIFHVIKNFELTVIEKTKIPIEYSVDHFSPMIKGGFWIGFKRRLAASICPQ